MSETTGLPDIRIVGPRLALADPSPDSKKFTWYADLSVAFLEWRNPLDLDEFALVNYTQGLRVLLQAPESDAKATTVEIDVWDPRIRATVQLRTPHLLIGNVLPRESTLTFAGSSKGYAVRAAVPEGDPEKGKTTHGVSSLVLIPLDPWPTNQRTRDIEVPRFAMGEQRLRVLISVTKKRPEGFLRLARISNTKAAAFVGTSPTGATDSARLPRVELQLIKIEGAEDGPFVAVDLTPDGIEMRGTVANPLRAFGLPDPKERIDVILRLVHRPDPLPTNRAVWSLELVREEDEDASGGIGNRIRQALGHVRAAFAPARENPLVLDIDTVAENLAVRWPLDLKDESLRLIGSGNDGWQLWIDAAALRARLRGSPVRGGELPTEVAFVPNLLALSGSGAGVALALDADRRDRSQRANRRDEIPGPCVTMTRAGQAPTQISIADAKADLTWFLDQNALARNLAERYAKAGVHPDGATTTYAFIPLTDGWLQLPLGLDDSANGLDGDGVVTTSVGFEGSVAFALDDPPQLDGPRGRRIEVVAADHVHATAVIAGRAATSLQIDLRGAAGTADGVLWIAAGSPSPENIVPQFDAGPAALMGPPLAFGRLKDVPAHLMPLSSGAFAPNKKFDLKLPVTSKAPTLCLLWRGYADLPLVTAIGMTRTAESSGNPSSTRGLVCRELERSSFAITLAYGAAHGFASLALMTKEGMAATPDALTLVGGDKGPFAQVPLVPVTLPGIELLPCHTPFEKLKARLRFDLPVLDELFANTRLPEKAPVVTQNPAPEPPLPDATTSLDVGGLMSAWQKAVDRLNLSRVEGADAIGFGAQTRRKVKIESLFEGATWTTDFSLAAKVRIGTGEYAFGTYDLGGEQFPARKALQGLSRAFDVVPDLMDATDESKNPLRVIGFAAALWEDTRDGLTGWRDTRAAITAKSPKAELFGDNARGDGNGLLLREIGVVDLNSKKTARSSRATLAKPIPISLPVATDRTLGLWFRDLPLEAQGARQLTLVKDAEGPELTIGPTQSAFDRARLPRSIYEWRLCNDAKTPSAQPPSAYEVALGPFRFRPLRLLDLVLAKDEGWNASSAKICGTVSLAKEGASTLDAGPFEPELAYATGNLVAIALVKSGDGLTFAGAGWEGVEVDIGRTPSVAAASAAQLIFRLNDVPVCLGSEETPSGTTTMRLALAARATAGSDGLPQFSAVTLTTVVFGRLVVFEKGKVTIKPGEIIATFEAPSGVALDGASGVVLTAVRISIPSGNSIAIGQKPKMTLDGQLKIVAADPETASDAKPLEVVCHDLGGPLYWLNHEVKSPGKMVVEHRRGVIDLTGTIPDKSVQPIAGLTAASPVVRITLTVAILQKEPKAASNPSYVYTSISGFGEYALTSSDGPTKRFDHVIGGNDRAPGPIWTSQITVDLSLDAHQSRIHWPIGSLPDKVKTLDGNEVALAGLAALVSARALRGSLKEFDPNTALKHVVTMAIAGQRVATAALRVDERDKERRVAFAVPWTFHALAEHRIIDPREKGRTLTWTTFDHVNAIDARILVDAAKNAVKLPQPFKDGIFAFAGRYKNIWPDEGPKSPVVKAGIVLRAFAQAGFPVEALAIELAKLAGEAFDDGIIISAAGPTTVATELTKEGPFWPDMPPGTEFISKDRHGVILALPWLTAIDKEYTLNDTLSSFNQAPATGTAAWDAPDVDWAAGSPAPLARGPAAIQAIGSGSADDIATLLIRAFRRKPDATPVRALAPVEQLFLRPVKEGATIKELPMWLRSLLALRTVWLSTAAVKRTNDTIVAIDERVTMIVPSGEADGVVARFKLGPRRLPVAKDAETLVIAACGQVVAVDRERTAFEPIPVTEALGRASDPRGADAVRRARLVGRAARLVKEPVAVVAVAAESGVSEPATNVWIRVGMPSDLDDGALDIPIEINVENRLYASPALGWPTARGTGQSATGAMGMGEDRAFQDAGPEEDPAAPPPNTPDDIKNYGSGLSGRAASLSLPARADTGSRPDSEEHQPFIDTRSPAFIALGRKMIFNRPASADLPIVSPPARHLSPTEARVVVPVSQDLREALKRVVKGQAAPIVPPHLERTSLGLRPGAMQAEFDALLFTDGFTDKEIAAGQREDMSPGIGRFGRPGHAGPRLVRQLRPPRGPALPRVPLSPQDFVTSHGRRTFVELDDHAVELESDGTVTEQDARFPTPFRLFEGVATVLRRHYQSYWIRLREMPLLPEWDGKLTLRVTSPSYREPGLPEALAQLGFLRDGDKGLGAALSIDRFIVRFRNASWLEDKDAVELTIDAEPADLADVRSRLDAVDGDSQVVLQFRCGRDDDSAAVPPPTFALSTRADCPDLELEAETRRHFALRVPVRPTAQPSLNVGISTLVFADPSYDRELSGPGPSDSQRDKSGLLWKVALDRFEYGVDTPVHLAFGPIDAATGLFNPKIVPKASVLSLQRQPARKDDENVLPPEDLVIAGVERNSDTNKHAIDAAAAYGVTFDRLRVFDLKKKQIKGPVKFLDGDQIVVSIGFTVPGDVERTLSVRAMVVPRPIIAPPPAVYALVAPFDESVDTDKKTARVALHATAPLPQRVEYPNLLDDLAIGHIRRRALFIWLMSNVPTASPRRATLVKIDRAGGGQLPERRADLFTCVVGERT